MVGLSKIRENTYLHASKSYDIKIRTNNAPSSMHLISDPKNTVKPTSGIFLQCNATTFSYSFHTSMYRTLNYVDFNSYFQGSWLTLQMFASRYNQDFHNPRNINLQKLAHIPCQWSDGGKYLYRVILSKVKILWLVNMRINKIRGMTEHNYFLSS